MDREHVESRWEQMKAYAHQEWEALTDDDLAEVKGNRERLIDLIQQRYGVPRDEAKRQVDEWVSRL